MIPKQTDQFAENEKLFIADLPEGWSCVKLPKIADINMGQSPPGSSYNTDSDGLPLFQGKADFGKRYPTARVWCTEPRKIAKPGDVLISVRAPVGPSNVADHKCIIGRGLAALTPLAGIPTEFILFAVRLLEPELSLSGTGSTFTAINKKYIENIEINLPPLEEQKRIVAKVEELLARVNAAREHLAKVQKILKRFRQSVLAAACSGRLTAEWREQEPNMLHAKDFLYSIISEHPKFKEKARGKRNKISKFQSKYQVSQIGDSSDFEELPYGWVLGSGAHLFTWSSGKFLPKKKQKSGQYPIYGGNGITGYHSEYLVDYSTLVIGRVGALCGNVYITTEKAWVTDNAIYANYVPTDLNLSYAYLVFTQAKLNADAGGSGQPFVNQTVLNEVSIPLPPLAEQNEIVHRVESLFKLADAIEKRVTAATAHAEKLNHAILSKAFRGELVPTEAELARQEDCSYESASLLLSKIKTLGKDS